nr:hypothetical protein HmN_000552700 [Hymenolepis microstoma]
MKSLKLERDDSLLSQLSDVTLCFACDMESRICNNDGYSPVEDNPPDFNLFCLRGLRRTFSSSARLDALSHPLNYAEYEETSAPAFSLPGHHSYLLSSDDSNMYWRKFEQDLMFNKSINNVCEIVESKQCAISRCQVGGEKLSRNVEMANFPSPATVASRCCSVSFSPHSPRSMAHGLADQHLSSYEEVKSGWTHRSYGKMKNCFAT